MGAIFIQKKEVTQMPNIKSLKQVHDDFCDYEVNKAKSLRIKTVRKPTERKSNGIRTSGLSRAMLVMELSSLF